MPATLGLVFCEREADRFLIQRTLRWLREADIEARVGLPGPVSGERDQTASPRRPVWLLRAGAWPARRGKIAFPPPSSTSRPLVALGTIAAGGPVAQRAQAEEAAWADCLARTGGDLTGWAGLDSLPIASAYLEAEVAWRVGRRVVEGEGPLEALRREIAWPGHRVVHFAALDALDDERVRVAQIITSLQIGGAERVAYDLSIELGHSDIENRLIFLNPGNRTPYPMTTFTAAVQAVPGVENRLDEALSIACGMAADVLHAHLIDANGLRHLAASGIPLIATIHNTRPGWPAGIDGLGAGDVALLIACAQAVERDLRRENVPIPIRVVWNGIDLSAFALSMASRQAGWERRRALGFGARDLVLISVANPRPQKRLDRLPAVLEAVNSELLTREPRRQARLILAGETRNLSPEAGEAFAQFRREAKARRIDGSVHETGLCEEVRPLLAAADCLISTSAHDGLSLAQVEALAMGLPVVATDAGGAAELARSQPGFVLLPEDSEPAIFAKEVIRLASERPAADRAVLDANFSRGAMARRYQWLYRRVANSMSPGRHRGGLLLVTNNFSTGGAQSSARRLLLGLKERGFHVRAAVLQELPDHPTPGRLLLEASGVPVLAPARAGPDSPEEMAAAILRSVDAEPPRAVLFWNAIADHKVLLADALWEMPIYEVSPGEMFFSSLERYFANPGPGMPYRSPVEYGERLAGVVVKYAGESELASTTLRAPVHVIPNGVAASQVARRGSPGSVLALGTAARLSPQKKLEDLLAAIRLAGARLPPYVLRIAGAAERGSEEYAASLREAASGLPVEFTGGLDDIGEFLDALDVFLQVSEPAGCPNASLEAMARGLPVVATDWGGAGEQVVDGVTGRLIPRGDLEAFASAVVELAHSPELRASMGAAGRERIEKFFSLAGMVDGYARLCKLHEADALPNGYRNR